MVGGRDGGTARLFIDDLAGRLANKVQITTDGHKAYLEAIEEAFGSEIDYAMLIKLYGAEPEQEKRYSPSKCVGTNKSVITGEPDRKHISTSYVERQKPDHAHGDETFHSANERFLKESGKLNLCRISSFHVVQFRTSSPNSEGDPSYGSRSC
jgi:hypothetical protein